MGGRHICVLTPNDKNWLLGCGLAPLCHHCGRSRSLWKVVHYQLDIVNITSMHGTCSGTKLPGRGRTLFLELPRVKVKKMWPKDCWCLSCNTVLDTSGEGSCHPEERGFSGLISRLRSSSSSTRSIRRPEKQRLVWSLQQILGCGKSSRMS